MTDKLSQPGRLLLVDELAVVESPVRESADQIRSLTDALRQ